MPQFVLLHHECPSGVPRPTHWDFMLEEAGVLRTWVLMELPPAWQTAAADSQSSGANAELPPEGVPAEEIQPHRIDYLTLKGPLSGGRGSVSRVDRGLYERTTWSDCLIQVRLAGATLQGGLSLSRPHPQTCHWRLSPSTADWAAR